MQLYTEQPIPKYAFEPDTDTGNPMLRIAKNDAVIGHNMSDFLVPHRKDYYFMAFVKKSGGRHWIDMKPYELKPDTFYFTVPHQVHLKEEVKPFTGVVLSFSNDFLAVDNESVLKNLPIIQNQQNGHELILQPRDIIFLEDILDRILEEYHGQQSWKNDMLRAYMRSLLIYLSRLYNEQYNNKKLFPARILLNNFLSKIDESFTEVHEVAAYAGMLNVSAGHLSELVKEQSGKPAIMHIHERLILEAKRILFHTDYAVKEIAYHLGFEDASYFNRFFKRLTKLTPAEYRSSIREMYH